MVNEIGLYVGKICGKDNKKYLYLLRHVLTNTKWDEV